MKLFRSMAFAGLAAAALILAGCNQATGDAPKADNTPKTVVLADFEAGLGAVTVTQGYNGLAGVSGVIDTTAAIVGSTHGKVLKVTYGSAATKTFGQTNVLIPLAGVDYSAYKTVEFDIYLADQSYAGWLPVLRGAAGADATWNDAWAAADTNNDATGDALGAWIHMAIPVSTFAKVSWGQTVTKDSLSAAFKGYANFDLNLIENGYSSANNNDGTLKTAYLDNIALVP